MSSSSSSLSFRLRRLIYKGNQRRYADPIAWSVFFLLTIGFCTLHLLNEFYFIKQTPCELLDFIVNETDCVPAKATPLDAFIVILKSGIFFTLIMMVPVYLNLEVLKKHTLDRKVLRVWTYAPYLFAALINAIIFSWVIKMWGNANPDWMRIKLRFWVNALSIFGVQLISTGILYRREALDYTRQLEKALRKLKLERDSKQKIEEENEELKEKLQEVVISGAKNVLKVGTKKQYKIIPLNEILYLQGDGNEPLIFTTDGRKTRGSMRLSEYLNFLPDDQFIQVHRSFIVAKNKVRERKGNSLMLIGKIEIPISKTFDSKVEMDSNIGFHPEIDNLLSEL